MGRVCVFFLRTKKHVPEKLYDQSHGVNGGSSPSVVALSLAELFHSLCGIECIFAYNTTIPTWQQLTGCLFTRCFFLDLF